MQDTVDRVKQFYPIQDFELYIKADVQQTT